MRSRSANSRRRSRAPLASQDGSPGIRPSRTASRSAAWTPHAPRSASASAPPRRSRTGCARRWIGTARTGRRSVARFLITGINYAPEPIGNAPYTAAYAEALAAAGHRVDVVTGYPHYPEWTAEHRRLCWSAEAARGVRVHRVPHAVPARADALGRFRLEASFGLATLPSMARVQFDA